MYGIIHYSNPINLLIRDINNEIYKKKELIAHGLDICITQEMKKIKIIDISMYYNLKKVKFVIDKWFIFKVKMVNNIISDVGTLRNLEELVIHHCTKIRGLCYLKNIKKIIFECSDNSCCIFCICCYYSNVKKLLLINKDVNIIIKKYNESLSFKINHIFINTTKYNFIDKLKKIMP